MIFNYNLLKPLALLLETKSITATANQMSTSASAVSRTLRSLREIFQDELLTRKNGRMELTPKAISIRAKLNNIIHDIDELTEDMSFDPSTSDIKINIAMNSYIAYWLAPEIIQYFSENAPNIELTIEDWNELTPDRINNHLVHFGIHYFPLNLNKNLVQRKVGKDMSVMVCRKDHPINNESISLETIASYPLAIHLQKHWNERQDKLSRLLLSHGIDFKVKLKTTHINVIINAVETTDLLFPCSIYIAEQLGEKFSYITSSDEVFLPLQEKEFGFIYDKAYKNDPMIVWLHSTISKLMNDFLDVYNKKFDSRYKKSR
ncbi:TPA: LysR family transcriptional regulator [Vibrio parahaemolyticus]